MAVYLRRGLGRVVLFLRDQNQSAVRFRDVVLHAVLHDVRYDRQSEDHRTPYLYDVVQATGEPDWYAARLCETMQEAAAGDESDEEQRCELAARFAENGSQNARHALYVAFERSVRAGEPVGAESLIALDGAAGFQFVAERSHAFLPPDENLMDYGYVKKLVDKLGGEMEARQATDRMGTDAPHLAPHLCWCWNDWHDMVGGGQAARLQKAKQQRQNDVPQTYGAFQTALNEAEKANGGRPSRPLLFRAWGRTASDDLILRLAHDIKAGVAEERLRHLLLLFNQRPFPLAPDALLPLTLHPNRRISLPAVQALSHLTHPDVRAQGLRLIEMGRISEGIDLIVKNSDASDAILFDTLLRKPHQESELHSIGISLREYLEASPLSNATALLLVLYENGPCSMCRASTVKMLLDTNALPDTLRAECRYDADEDTRQMVASPPS